MTMAILHQFVPNSGDAWRHTREEVRRYFDRALAKHQEGIRVKVSDHSLLDLTGEEPPPLVAETLGAYIEFARLLGRRTAELHQALASRDDDPAFAPEPITGFYQRAMYQSMRNLTSRVFRVLNDRARTLPDRRAGRRPRAGGHARQDPGGVSTSSSAARSRRSASAVTATITWARCSTPARTS